MTTPALIGIWLIVGSSLLILGTVCLVVVAIGWKYQEERLANGRRDRTGSRPEAGRQGWIDAWGDEGPSPHHSHQGEDE
jgi:hypothetical protein